MVVPHFTSQLRPYDYCPGYLRLFFLPFVHVADRLLSHHTWASRRESENLGFGISGVWCLLSGVRFFVFRTLEQIFGLQYFLSHLSHIYNAYPAIHAHKISSHLMWGGCVFCEEGLHNVLPWPASPHFLPLNNGNTSFLNHYSDIQFPNIHPPNILSLLGCKSDLQNRITG